MNDREARAIMQEIADYLLENDLDGVHWLRIREEFKRRTSDADRSDLAESYLDDLIGRWAKDVANSLRGSKQPKLPGFEWDSTVTVTDGEGSFRVKHLRFASDADLDADLEIHDLNVAAAAAARARAADRNRTLQPLMREHGFVTAGEALEYLKGQR